MAGYRMDCENCGRRFSARRYDAKYCSAKCRTAAHRDAKAVGKSIEKIAREIWRLPHATKDGMSIQDMEALTNLAHEIAWIVAREKNRRDDKRTIADIRNEETQKNPPF